MPVAGVVVLTRPEEIRSVLEQLDTIENVTTYGIHKENYIVSVFEGKTAADLEKLSSWISDNIPGVLGVYPAYVNYEDEN